MSYNLNSVKVVHVGDHVGSIIGLIKGDTRSLDHSSHRNTGAVGLECIEPVSKLGPGGMGRSPT